MSIRNVARSLAAAVLVGAGFVGTAQASTIAIVPGSQTIAPGATTGIDIVLTGLSPSETVGAFSIVLTFNDTILDGLSYTNDPGNKMGPPPRDCLLGPCDLSNGFTPVGNSPLDLFYAADLVTPEATLHALQTGAPFVLAHVEFRGASEGLSPLTLGFQPAFGTFLSNFAGLPISPTSITRINGSICVDDPQTPGDRCVAGQVPEPATLSLLGAGLAAAVARRRRKATKA
jgi:PEP-CTERM motif-containing protein